MNTAIEKVKVSELENKIITNNQLKDNLEDVAIMNIDNDYYLYNTKTKENYFQIDGEGLTTLELLNLKLDSIKTKITSDLSKLKEEIKEPKEPKTLTEAIENFKKSKERDLSVFNKFFSSKLTSADLELLKLNLDKEKFEACLKLQLTRKNIDFKINEGEKGTTLDVFKKGLIQAYGDVVGNNYYNTLLVLSNNDEKKLEAQWIEFILQKNGLNTKLDELGINTGEDNRSLFENKGLVGLVDEGFSSFPNLTRNQRAGWTKMAEISGLLGIIYIGFDYFKRMGFVKGLGVLVGLEFGSHIASGKSLFHWMNTIVYGGFENPFSDNKPMISNEGKKLIENIQGQVESGKKNLSQGGREMFPSLLFNNISLNKVGKYLDNSKEAFNIDSFVSDNKNGDITMLTDMMKELSPEQKQQFSKRIYQDFKVLDIHNNTATLNVDFPTYKSKHESIVRLVDSKGEIINDKKLEIFNNYLKSNISKSDLEIFNELNKLGILDKKNKANQDVALNGNDSTNTIPKDKPGLNDEKKQQDSKKEKSNNTLSKEELKILGIQ